MKNKLMYIEPKGTDTPAPARIGRMSMSSFSRVLTYLGKLYQPHVDRQTNANFYQVGSGHWYWITHCHKDGIDSLSPCTVHIDDDAQQEYWENVRRQPEMIGTTQFQSPGKRR